MKNGAWNSWHFARFSAVRQYDNHRLDSRKNGLDINDMVSRKEFIRLLEEAGNVDPFEFTNKFIKKQTEEARKNNSYYYKRKRHDYKDKGKKKLEEDVPIREGYHELNLNDPEVVARIEEMRKRVFSYLKEKEKKEKAKAKAKANQLEKRRRWSREE